MPIYPPVRTFHARHGRISAAGRRALATDVPNVSVTRFPGPVNLRQLWPGRSIVIDFGAGMGAHTLELARAGHGVLMIDVHAPGVARVASAAVARGWDHVAVHLGDGVELLTTGLAQQCADEIHVLFPDPWPKARHHKRRLIGASFLAAAHAVLIPGGRLVIVSDDAGYTEHIRHEMETCQLFSRDSEDFVYAPTGYHERALRLGNSITVFSGRAAAP